MLNGRREPGRRVRIYRIVLPCLVLARNVVRFLSVRIKRGGQDFRNVDFVGWLAPIEDRFLVKGAHVVVVMDRFLLTREGRVADKVGVVLVIARALVLGGS